MEDNWISTEEKPLVTINEDKSWFVNDGVPDEFLAALQVFNKIDSQTTWWIRHCIIAGTGGLCVVTDDDYEPAGWEITDVEFYQPLPAPPQTTQQ